VEAVGALIHLVQQVSAAREIREALGVARDERQQLEERITPLPSLSW
jgi:hypothetical protein